MGHYLRRVATLVKILLLCLIEHVLLLLEIICVGMVGIHAHIHRNSRVSLLHEARILILTVVVATGSGAVVRVAAV